MRNAIKKSPINGLFCFLFYCGFLFLPAFNDNIPAINMNNVGNQKQIVIISIDLSVTHIIAKQIKLEIDEIIIKIPANFGFLKQKKVAINDNPNVAMLMKEIEVLNALNDPPTNDPAITKTTENK